MKKIRTLILILAFAVVSVVNAQAIRVLPVSSDNISNNAADVLYNRLNQLVTLNGLASTDNSNKFLLVPSVTVLSIEPTATAPVKYMAEVEVSLFLVDNTKKLVMSQETVVKRGVAENESKAVSEAVRSIKSRDPKLKKMIVNGKKKIKDYYDTECETVVKTINAYLECGMVNEALNELNAIPQIDENNGCYDNALNILSKISQEQQNSANSAIENETPDVSWINE